MRSAKSIPPSTLPSTYHSQELAQAQMKLTSPMGMQFLTVPLASAPSPMREKASTRTCDETSMDGKSKLDCIDDDD